MAERRLSQGTKTVLDLAPVIGFVVAYQWVKDDTFTIGGVDYDGFIVVTAAFVPVILASMGLIWWLTGRLSRMQAVTAVMVVVFGGLSVWLNDDRFFKMKTSIVYALFGTLLALGLARGRSWLQFVMEEIMPLRDEGWMILTRRVMWLFFGLAAANEIVWRTQSTETWVWIESFGLPAVVFVFFMAQSGLLSRHAIDQDPRSGDDTA